MMRISTLCVASGAVAVLALSANAASAEVKVPHVNPPKVTVHTQPMVAGPGGLQPGPGGRGSVTDPLNPQPLPPLKTPGSGNPGGPPRAEQ